MIQFEEGVFAVRKVVCELCGSNELKKDGDDFVCQNCGTRYTPEEAKKLLVDIKVSGTVAVDGVATVGDIIARAKKEEKAGNYNLALDYYKRAEKVSPMSKEAQAGMKRIDEVFEHRKRHDFKSAMIAGAVLFVVFSVFAIAAGTPSFVFAGLILGVIAVAPIYSFMRGVSEGQGLTKEE